MALNFNGTDVGTLKMGTTDIANAKMGSTDIYNNEIKIPKISLASGTHIAAAFVVGKKIILQTASVKYKAEAKNQYGYTTRPETHDPTYKYIITFNANNQSPSWVSKSSSVPINHRVSALVGNRIISFRGFMTISNVRPSANNMYTWTDTRGINAYSYDTDNETFKTMASWTQSTNTYADYSRVTAGTCEFDYVVDWYDNPILYMFSYGTISGFEIYSGYDYYNNTFSSPNTKIIINNNLSVSSYTYYDLGKYNSEYGVGWVNFNNCAKVLKSNGGSNYKKSNILLGGHNNARVVLNAISENSKFMPTNIPLKTGNYNNYPKEAIRRIFPAETCEYDGYVYYAQYRKYDYLGTMEDFTGFEIFKPSSSDIDETTPILSVVFDKELVYFNQYTGDVYQWNKKRWLKNGTVIS